MNQSVVIAPIQESLSQFISSAHYSKVIVITDNNTKKHCYPLLKSALPAHKLISVPSGEANKVLATCEKIWEAMTDYELDRHARVCRACAVAAGNFRGRRHLADPVLYPGVL